MNQSAAMRPRICSSSGVPTVPISFGRYGLSFWRPSSSRLSFHSRMKAEMTGLAQIG